MSEEATPKRSRWRMLRTFVLRLAATLVVLVALLLLAVFLLLRSESFGRFVLAKAMPAVNNALPGDIAYGGFQGGIGSRIELTDVVITDETGDPFITADTLIVEWEVFDLLFKEISASRVEIHRPVFTLKQRTDKPLNVVSAFVKPGPKKPKDDSPAKPLPFGISVGDVVLHDGTFVFERADGSRLVDVQEIELDAGYSLRGVEHDAAFRTLAARLDAPISIPKASLVGGARMHDYVLDLDDVVVSWLDDVIGVSGTLGPVASIEPNLQLDVQRFDLADVKQFAPSAPLQGVVTGPLRFTGTLDHLQLAGDLTTQSGGTLSLGSSGVRLQTPLGHHGDIAFDGFDLSEILDIPGLPPALTGTATWDGSGTNLGSLAGTATATLAPLRYQRMRLGPSKLAASLDGGVVRVDSLAVGLARGTPTLRGDIDLNDRCFDVRLGGGVGAIQDLRDRIPAPITRGSVRLNAGAKGCWSTDSDVVALSTKGTADIKDLALTPAETSVETGLLGWDLNIAVPKAPTAPLMSGPVTLAVTGLTTAKQVIDQADLAGVLSNERFTVTELTADSGPDLGAALAGHVDWSNLPTLAIHGERLKATYRSVTLATPNPFDFRVRDGAFEASGLVADAEGGGKLIVQGSLDPKGDTNALLRVLTFDLVQTDAFLPDDGKIRGTLEDLTVKLTGTASSPGLSVRTRLRQFATRGRGPIDLDLDLALEEGLLQGSARLDDLLTLDMPGIPMSFRLDGEGGLPFTIPRDEPLAVTLNVVEGALSRFEQPFGAKLPPNYVGGRVRGKVQLAGTTSNPTVDGGFLVRDLLVDLSRMETSSGTSNDADDSEVASRRQLTIQAAYELRDGEFALRDTKLRTNAEGTVLEVGARAAVPLGEYLMAVAGPREQRRLPPRMVSDLEVEASVRRLPMSLVHLLAPASEPVSGALEGKLVLSGALSAPTVSGDLELLGGRVRDRALKRLKLNAAVAKDVLNAQLELVPELLVDEKKETSQALIALANKPDAGRLVVRANAPLPLALDGSRTVQEMLGQPGLHGEVRTDGFPLPILLAFLPGAMDAVGVLDLTGTIGGTLLDPKPDVHLVMEDGHFKYQKTSVSYEDIDLDVALTPAGIVLNKAAVDTLPLIRNPLDLVFKPNVSKDTRQKGKRSLEGSGSIALDGWRLGAFDLSVRARKLWAMYTQEIKAQASGALQVDGLWPDIKVRGTLDVDDVNVEMGQETFGHKVASMELPGNLRVHRARDGAKEGTVATFAPVVRTDGSGLLDNYDADVLVRLGNKVRVKLAMGIAQGRDDALRALNMIGSIEPDVNVGGEVRVEVTDGSPKFVGELEVTRDSRLTALTKLFDIRPGSTLTMTGELLDSRMDIVADHPSNYGAVTVEVGGSLRKPEIAFSSEELADQGDIMAVLVTGKPLSEQTSAEGGGLMKTLSSALAGFGTKLLGKYTPLDKLDIDLGDDVSTGSVEAGKAITPELYLVSRFRWGVEDELENRVEAEVQFRPRGLRRFSIEAMIGDRLAGDVQVVWRLLY